MTQQQRRAWDASWPGAAIVAIGAVLIGFVIWVIPPGEAELRSAVVLGFLGVATSGLMVLVQRLSAKVDRVEQQTNGHMSRLIAAKTQLDENDR